MFAVHGVCIWGGSALVLPERAGVWGGWLRGVGGVLLCLLLGAPGRGSALAWGSQCWALGRAAWGMLGGFGRVAEIIFNIHKKSIYGEKVDGDGQPWEKNC